MPLDWSQCPAVESVPGKDEWFISEVEKGLAAAERGEFIEHEEIRKIIDGRYRQTTARHKSRSLAD